MVLSTAFFTPWQKPECLASLMNLPEVVLKSLPSIFNLIVLMFLFYLIVGILGINFFKGKKL